MRTTALPDLLRTWTVDELADLPDDANKYELVDGRLEVTPPPNQDHQLFGSQLRDLILRSAPSGWNSLPEFGVRFADDTQRQPDVAVFRMPPRFPTGDRHNPIGPADIGLLIEIVSPSSRRKDRFAKPGEYADAGIPTYWRLETEPELVLHSFVLEGNVYVADTIITERGTVPVPWGRVEVDLSTLGFP
jgi:Uma2 family endonuclease